MDLANSFIDPTRFAALAGRKVAVTGASGFIGAHLVQALSEAGAHVRAIYRRPWEHVPDNVDAIDGLSGALGLSEAFSGCDTLFHFAYDVRAGEDVNLALFDSVFDAAFEAGVSRFIHASSVAVYDNWPGNGLLQESDSWDGPPANAYVAAKRKMERSLLNQDKMSVAILQPTIVYGTERGLWSHAAIAALRSGGIMLPEPAGLCPAVHVNDVVQAALLAAAAPELAQHRFLINGPDELSWLEFFKAPQDFVGDGDIRMMDADDLQMKVGLPFRSNPTKPSLAARLGSLARGWL
jgi:nucleoside-diphosphate-sugar epimerase